MANFSKLNENITKVMLKLIESQELCKYLHYNSNDPLSEPDVDPYSLLMNKIFPQPKIPGTNDTESSYLTIVFDSFRLGNDNKGVKDGELLLTVFVHNNLWVLEGQGQIRPISIISEIDKLFNSKRIVGIKELQFKSGRFVQPNETYAGYQVIYKVVSGNNGDSN